MVDFRGVTNKSVAMCWHIAVVLFFQGNPKRQPSFRNKVCKPNQNYRLQWNALKTSQHQTGEIMRDRSRKIDLGIDVITVVIFALSFLHYCFWGWDKNINLYYQSNNIFCYCIYTFVRKSSPLSMSTCFVLSVMSFIQNQKNDLTPTLNCTPPVKSNKKPLLLFETYVIGSHSPCQLQIWNHCEHHLQEWGFVCRRWAPFNQLGQ